MKITKLTRAEKAEVNLTRLYRAAAEVISEKGFTNATVSRITERAELGTGTFYNYFASREEILARIVDTYGRELRQSIKLAIPNKSHFFASEEISFRAYFRFLKQHPFFIAIINESAIFIPPVYDKFFESIMAGYRLVLKDASRKGEIRPLRGVQIEGTALMLMASRHYFGEKFLAKVTKDGNLPNRIVNVYMQMIIDGLKKHPD